MLKWRDNALEIVTSRPSTSSANRTDVEMAGQRLGDCHSRRSWWDFELDRELKWRDNALEIVTQALSAATNAIKG
jgi:hypothetical protein